MEGGVFWIVQKDSGTRVPQWPPTFSLQKQCILTSVTDQGSVNLSVLDYIEYHVGLMVCIGFDHQHRCWNDLKSSLKTAKLFRSFLAYGLLFNLNYAPMGSKAWFAKKAAALQSFIEDHSCHTEPFLSYMPLFCAERCQVETGTVEQREAMWIELHQLSAFTDSWKAEDVFQAVFVVLVGCPADQSDLRLVRVDEL